jgi:hypothetical protein
MKRRYCTLYDELQDSKKHSVMLEQHIYNSNEVHCKIV